MFRLFLMLIPLFFCHFATAGPHSHLSPSGFGEVVPDTPSRRDNKHYKNGVHDHEFDHESILGSHNAAEEFEQLSPEESKKRLAVLARLMDKDKNGYVNRRELSDWVFKSFEMLTEEEALDQLEDEDSDNDGKITWQEHAADTYGVYDDEALYDDDDEKKSTEEYKMLQNDKEIFDAADRDKDGILDKSEFPAFSHPEAFQHMNEILYKQAMSRYDKNMDGFLSLDEFIMDHNLAMQNPQSEHYVLEKDRFTNDLDLNRDGKLNKEEVLKWLIPDNIEMAETEADHLIESSDENKDGKLSINEIVNHHDIFVGSEATDFGEYLHSTHRFNDEL